LNTIEKQTAMKNRTSLPAAACGGWDWEAIST
jgi:hypothetical protein